ncbi:flavo protein monooxygenase [Trichoderma atroviride IMI 206040]|uniref:Flavo protein monooxygenase n=2 Tax=Hypocrea atroviridis TaxID=63577 RepID=G9P0I9_HYPAI|nr:flavo protein monooxygenase [Trichoderma atroviride IMI 206040]EHK42360.1 flavo protein monooxygenase [Trichoderma atroviride IMI 206040]
MSGLKILICGGGCAGPALAYWLAQSGHRVVVVERFKTLRATGAQLDVSSQGLETIERMGLLDNIRSKRVNELGTSFVDSHGNVKATFMANKSGKGTQSVTCEYEIMRGDLVQILYDTTKDSVEYVFGKTVESFEQNEERVVVYFSDNSSDTFDIVVGADGQGSRIRGMILPAGSPNPYRELGVYVAYWVIPRTEEDGNLCTFYTSSGGRMIMRRSHSPTETQVYLTLRDDSKELQNMPRASVEKQKEFWTERFRDAGWETARFLQGLKTAENFYCQHVVQVRTDTWYKGRVVLVGDAAYCPSPFSGMGTTGSFVGAYVLAGEINRSPSDLNSAFANYNKTLRPFVNEIQKVSQFFVRFGLPETQFGASFNLFLAQMVSVFRIPDFIAKYTTEENSGWKLPDY